MGRYEISRKRTIGEDIRGLEVFLKTEVDLTHIHII